MSIINAIIIMNNKTHIYDRTVANIYSQPFFILDISYI